MISGKRYTQALSGPIIRIAIAGIAIGMCVMILSIAVVSGFQREIRNKVIGFGSHIQITSLASENPLQPAPISIRQDFYPYLDTVQGVRHIQTYALKQGILETPTDIQGVNLKGVGKDFDWSFFGNKLVAGRKLPTDSAHYANDIMISRYLAKRLELHLGDKVSVYFPEEDDNIRQRNFRVTAIYDTGLQELDKLFVFCDIRTIQHLNKWGIDASLKYLGCRNDSVVLKAGGFGGRNVYRYRWSDSLHTGEGPYAFCVQPGKNISVKVYDKWGTLPDTATFHFTGNSAQTPGCICPSDSSWNITTTGGSGKYYTGGFEVILKNYKDLERMDDIIYNHIDVNMRTTTILQQDPEIFNWLDMLDINVEVLIILMVAVAVISMTSALLILILERTNMIGILKAMGASNWLVRKIFLYNAIYLIVVGFLLGNFIGLGLCYLQSRFGWMKLDPSNYYVSQVPIHISGFSILLLNAGAGLVCFLVLILPTYVITRISPVKAIRFD